MFQDRKVGHVENWRRCKLFSCSTSGNWETDHDGSFKNLWSHSGNNETVWSLPNKPTGAIINAVEAAQPGPAIQEMQIPLDDADATVHRLYAFEIPETPRHRAREVPLVDPPNRVADAEIGLKGPGVEENWSKVGKIPWKLTSEAQGAIPITMKSAESFACPCRTNKCNAGNSPSQHAWSCSESSPQKEALDGLVPARM